MTLFEAQDPNQYWASCRKKQTSVKAACLCIACAVGNSSARVLLEQFGSMEFRRTVRFCAIPQKSVVLCNSAEEYGSVQFFRTVRFCAIPHNSAVLCNSAEQRSSVQFRRTVQFYAIPQNSAVLCNSAQQCSSVQFRRTIPFRKQQF
jgi:hypothetical protein